MHLQSAWVVAATAVRFAGEDGGQIDEHLDRRVHPPEGRLHGLPVVTDRLQLAHRSIIRSNNEPLLGTRTLTMSTRAAAVHFDPFTAGQSPVPQHDSCHPSINYCHRN
jgi:hypothetical protein